MTAAADAAEVRLGLVSDTHGHLHPGLLPFLRGVSRILHAGDIGGPEILDGLGAIAPVVAVCGNTDVPHPVCGAFPDFAELEAVGRRILITHNREDRRVAAELRRRGAKLLVFGHSHRPTVQPVGGAYHINPGSAGRPRFGLPPTAAILTLHPSRSPDIAFWNLDGGHPFDLP